MGTRADFYVGRGVGAEWLGSIGWDGYPSGVPNPLLHSKDEADYRAKVEEILKDEGATRPSDGWPWPWEDSRTTDYAYAWDNSLYVACFGHAWVSAIDVIADEAKPGGDRDESLWGGDAKTCAFPNMKDRQNVTLGKRSGLIVIG